MTPYQALTEKLDNQRYNWLVTGAAGFIGSNICERLLELGQSVVGLDNFATGHKKNLEELSVAGGGKNFRFVEGDIRKVDDCRDACRNVDYVVHLAALGSVPRSIKDPLATHAANVDGFINMLVAANGTGVKRVVFASSSSVYGDHPDLPKVEERIGRPLSPYAASKRIDEVYAEAFGKAYGLECIGMRYFNVFGRRQDPNGVYAAVIPRWFAALLKGEIPVIFGDGETSRDFCHVENVIQANLLAALADNPTAVGQIYNIACGNRTTLNGLFRLIRDKVAEKVPSIKGVEPTYGDFRAGDVRHSLADVSKARKLIGYDPAVLLEEGIGRAADYYLSIF